MKLVPVVSAIRLLPRHTWYCTAADTAVQRICGRSFVGVRVAVGRPGRAGAAVSRTIVEPVLTADSFPAASSDVTVYVDVPSAIAAESV